MKTIQIPMNLNDLYIQTKVRAGDIREFERLFMKYHEPLCRHANKILNDMDTAEDLVQEFFYNFWKNRESFTLKFSLNAYLHQSIRNNALHYTQHLAVRKNYSGKVLREFSDMMPANLQTDVDLKELETLELWIDKLYGEVIFKVEWRPDSDPCWRLWREWKECEPRTSCEAPEDVCYPLTQCREGFRATMTLPKPPTSCGSNTGRPAHIGYQHQLRLTIKGWARLRGLLVHATKRERELFKNLVP